MDFKNLITFVHVAEVGSFSRAAERLGYSQPTISVQIRQLEQELGFRLFDRIGHAVRLTDKGRDALHYAQQVCRLCQQMADDTAEQEKKTTLIRLATSDSLSTCLLQDNFLRLRSNHPHISLNLTTAGTDEMFRLLEHNEVDLVCTLDSHIYNTNYVIAGEEKIGLHFIVSSRSPLAQKAVLTREDLRCEHFLLTEKGMSYRRLLDERLARSSLEIQPVLETGRADLICKLAQENAGIAFLPDYVTAESVWKGKLVRLNVQDFRVVVWKQMLYRREKWLSQQMQVMIDHMSDIRLLHR